MLCGDQAISPHGPSEAGRAAKRGAAILTGTEHGSRNTPSRTQRAVITSNATLLFMIFPHQRLMHPSKSIPLVLSRQGKSKQGTSQDCLHVPGRRPYAALSGGLESGSWGAPPRVTTSWLCDLGGPPAPGQPASSPTRWGTVRPRPSCCRESQVKPQDTLRAALGPEAVLGTSHWSD